MSRELITVELFSGTESFSKVMREHGYSTETYELERRFGADHRVDILVMNTELVPFGADILWASPPCEGFSVARIGRNWHHDNTPKTNTAAHALKLVEKTLRIIGERKPIWWFIENPQGKLKSLPVLESYTMHTIWYCHYGDTRAKPTNIWTNARWWKPRPQCHQRRKGHTEGCCCFDHEASPRGSRTGTQGLKNYEERSRIPPQLFHEILEQMPL